MRNHRRLGIVFVISAVLALALVACSGRHGGEEQGSGTRSGGGGGSLTIKGSDTMVIMAQRWAEAFMAKNPGTRVQVSGGGSGTGIAALINGTADVATSSRAIKDREREQVREGRDGAQAHETRVALDALAIYVHRDNPIASLTIPQLRQIYRNEVTNWNQVGGPHRPIVLYSRENNSGTYAYFKEHVLDDADFAPTTQTLPGTAAVINAVSRDSNAIGYGGIAFGEGVRVVPVAGEDGTPVEPNLANATSGRYPISRFLHLYTAGEPQGTARQFIDFTLSPEGQRLVENVGYYPLPREGQAAAAGAGGATAPATP
jgi:phosphate transport system substrate-binding protein